MKNFGIFVNPYYDGLNDLFRILKELRDKNDLNYYKLNMKDIDFPDFIDTLGKMEADTLDCILTFGGDGTFLRAVEFSLKYDTPLLGINLGKLGFLSESSLEELEKSIDDLKKNKFRLQARLLLKVTLKRQGKVIFTSTALNDVVINKGALPKLIDVRVSSNRRYVMDARCDGILAATPTGSTAYSLSGGGPIISPVMNAIVVNPLNPHILSLRPIVFNASDIIELKLINTSADCLLQLDGKNDHNLKEGDEVLVTADSRKVKFIKLTNKTFYQILRKKLHMGRT
ncbi:NAD(+)/NADH kinase [Candidatus Cloacimonadota bacterium]